MCSILVLLGAAFGSDQVAIPAGEFPMGCDRPECTDSAGPVHTVTLSAYAIDRLEVTQAEWLECVGARACARPPVLFDPVNTGDWPVVGVTRSDAGAYCAFRGGRLPTEAEWERAAAGPTGRVFPWGDQAPDCTLAQLPMCGRPDGPVGQHPAGASAEGVEDLVGNAWEIVSDYFDPDYYASSPSMDPRGGALAFLATVRGPSAWTLAHVQAAFRLGVPLGTRSASMGFRCVTDVS